jgi:hypothetical protein
LRKRSPANLSATRLPSSLLINSFF